jgi:2-polyprenyl-3-methyl-5-hydroxy-6-metoxy-1,4-benzoquinol methylase
MQITEAENYLIEKNIAVSDNIKNLDMHFSLDSLSSLNSTEDGHFWHKNRKYILKKLIKGLKLPNSIKGADIGCGNGSILAFLEQQYPESKFVGIDGYPEALINCRSRSNTATLQLQDITNLDPIENEEDRYDVVFLMDVLEHLETPSQTINKIKTVLKKGGYVVATVPACQSLWSSRDEFLGHYKRYSKTDFKNLFNSNGYGVVKANYFFSHLFFPTYLSRLIFSKISNKSGQEIESDELKIVPGINAILQMFGFLEINISMFLPLPFGTSVFCVAKND